MRRLVVLPVLAVLALSGCGSHADAPASVPPSPGAQHFEEGWVIPPVPATPEEQARLGLDSTGKKRTP